MALSDAEQEFVRQAYASAEKRNSNGFAYGFMVDHLRNHPSGGADTKARNLIERLRKRLRYATRP